MGTSGSSRGPKSGVPLVPEWVPPPPGQAQQPKVELAPPRRFQTARTGLGQFANSGSQEKLKRALGHYARSGLGGASSAANRMSGTAHSAGKLYGVLQSLSNGTPLPTDVGFDPTTLAGKSQAEIADAITDALRPSDGTQDSEAARDAMAGAFAELLQQEPEADLTDLTQDQIEKVVESYLARDLAHRIELDVGMAVLSKAPNAAEGVVRLEEMKAYVRQEVARCFRDRQKKGQRMSRRNSAALAQAILQDTFAVFESYL